MNLALEDTTVYQKRQNDPECATPALIDSLWKLGERCYSIVVSRVIRLSVKDRQNFKGVSRIIMLQLGRIQ